MACRPSVARGRSARCGGATATRARGTHVRALVPSVGCPLFSSLSFVLCCPASFPSRARPARSRAPTRPRPPKPSLRLARPPPRPRGRRPGRLRVPLTRSRARRAAREPDRRASRTRTSSETRATRPTRTTGTAAAVAGNAGSKGTARTRALNAATRTTATTRTAAATRIATTATETTSHRPVKAWCLSGRAESRGAGVVVAPSSYGSLCRCDLVIMKL